MRAIDLFSGAGGFTTGAAMAGCTVVWAANHWPAAVQVHANNHPGTLHVCQDLQQADWRGGESKMTRADLLACMPEPVAPGRCRACPPLGCFFSVCRAKCAAAGVPDAIAAQAEAEQITRELRASHGLAPAPGTLNCAARGEEECLAYGACGEAGRCVRATCGGKGPDHG